MKNFFSKSKIYRFSVYFFMFGIIVMLSVLSGSRIFHFTLNEFKTVEQNELKNDITRFVSVSNDLINDVETLLIDYSEWDDTYEFVDNQNQDYIDYNYYWEYTESSLGLNYYAITDLDGDILSVDSHDYEYGYLDIFGFNQENNDLLVDLINKYKTEETCHVYIDTSYGLFLFSMNNITDSMGEFAANGYMIFGVLLDQEVISDLEYKSGYNVSLVQENISEEFPSDLLFNEEEIYGVVEEQENFSVYIKIPTEESDDYFYRVEWQRDIYNIGWSSSQTIAITVGVTLSIIGITISVIVVLLLGSRSKFEAVSMTDYLTGLKNRRSFDNHLEKMNKIEKEGISIVMADINGLKLINDAFGHKKGDELINICAEILVHQKPQDCEVFRLGGDEFAAVIQDGRNLTETYIKNLNEEIENHAIQGINLSISFGAAYRNDKSEILQYVSNRAEDEMYRQKLLEIPSMRSNAVNSIVNTLFEKDPTSEEHSRRVSEYSLKIAEAMNLTSSEKTILKTAGLLHDIGKIIAPISILKKEGKLTDSEYAVIQKHSEIGFRILNSISGLRDISKVVLHHHERWDGEGYPDKKNDVDIPFLSRILTVADAFDAMTSERTYRRSFSKEEAIQELKACSGKQFDPDIVSIVIEKKIFE